MSVDTKFISDFQFIFWSKTQREKTTIHAAATQVKTTIRLWGRRGDLTNATERNSKLSLYHFSKLNFGLNPMEKLLHICIGSSIGSLTNGMTTIHKYSGQEVGRSMSKAGFPDNQ